MLDVRKKGIGRQKEEWSEKNKTGSMKERWEAEKIEGDEERPVSVSHYRCRQAVLAFVQP